MTSLIKEIKSYMQSAEEVARMYQPDSSEYAYSEGKIVACEMVLRLIKMYIGDIKNEP